MARISQKTLSVHGSKTIHRKVDRNLAWWDRPSGDAHEAVFAAVKHLDQTQPYRRESYVHYLRAYSNRLGLMAITGTDFGAAQDQGEKIRLNITKSAIDTATANIATNRPRAQYSTVNGPYLERKRAEGQTRFVDGVFNSVKQYVLALDIFLDACINGSGFEKVWQENGEIKVDRVHPDELVWDDNEAKYGKITNLFQHKEIAAQELISRYKVDPDEAELIRQESAHERGLEDSGSLVEAWRPPVGGKPGRHIVCSSGKTVHDEKFMRRPPFAKFGWSKSPVGYLDMGAAEELQPIQVEVNYIAQKIQRLMTLMTGIAWVQKGSGTTKRFTNRDGFMVGEYSGRPPIVQSIGNVAAEFFMHLDRLYQRGFEIMGISQMQATSTKPPGIEAAEALRTLNDIATKRFLHTGQRWEQFHLDVGELVLEAAREAKEQGHQVTSLAPGKETAELINFGEVALDKNSYVTRVYPTSIIPETPAGKIDLFIKLSQANPQMAMYQLAFMSGVPDLEAYVSRVNAPFELAEKMVSNILEKGEYTAPYPSMNLQASRDIGAKEEMRAVIQGIPRERLSLLRRWNGQLDAMIAASQSATNPGAPPNATGLAGALGPSPQGMPPMPPGASPDAMLNQALNAPVVQ